MPVKIVNSTTNSLTGQITLSDLEKMKTDFIDEVNLVPVNGRTAIKKKFTWYVTREEIEALFELNKTVEEGEEKEVDLLEINFAVHLNQPRICNPQTFLTDGLTVVMQCKTAQKDPSNPDAEFVLIPGYDNFPGGDDTGTESVPSKGCCPSSNP